MLSCVVTICLFSGVVMFLHGRPGGKLLNALPNGRIIQNIDAGKVHTLRLECLNDLGRKSAHGHGGIPLHVEHNGIVLDVLPNHFDGLVRFIGDRLFLRGKIVVGTIRKVATERWLLLLLLRLEKSCRSNGGGGTKDGGSRSESGASGSAHQRSGGSR